LIIKDLLACQTFSANCHQTSIKLPSLASEIGAVKSDSRSSFPGTPGTTQ